jgi:hypothetical protein
MHTVQEIGIVLLTAIAYGRVACLRDLSSYRQGRTLARIDFRNLQLVVTGKKVGHR